jgi:hypothetical protein
VQAREPRHTNVTGRDVDEASLVHECSEILDAKLARTERPLLRSMRRALEIDDHETPAGHQDAPDLCETALLQRIR